MSNFVKPVAEEFASEQLKILIKQLIKEKQYDGISLLFSSSKEAPRNLQLLPRIALDLYHDVCLKNLTDNTYKNNGPLYSCAEVLLKLVATYAPAEVLLLELLELIEDNKGEYVFTSALRALQIVLLRQGDQKVRALEWGLNSICTHLEVLPVPAYLRKGYDEKQKCLLEQDERIQNILIYFITVSLFYGPLLERICSQPRNDKEVFRPVGMTKCNVLCCFFIELLGKPLSLLNLSNDGKKTNTYSLQCAMSLTQGVTKCMGDPLFLLSFVESRVRFKRRLDASKGVYEMSSSNIFMINEKLPLDCLAIYYYMVFVERIDINAIPMVYHPLYILESGLYLVHELLLQHEPALHEKALLLVQKLLLNLNQQLISVLSLDLEVHKSFCLTVCNLVGYSPHKHLRQLGVKVLRLYILSFGDEGKYVILKNLIKSVKHHGISGYLTTLYKDLVAEALKNSEALPLYFCGKYFRSLFLENICHLSKGVEADLLEKCDIVISSLNAIRYFSLRDVENRTGFWDFAREIDEKYLKILRKALDLTIAHYKVQIDNIEQGLGCSQLEKLNLLDIDVINDNSKLDLQLDREKQINILNQNLCTFDLMRSLLSRASECLENNVKFKSSEC